MKHLKIQNFSSIKSASVDFSKLTVFIGPQASGKSILCKIAHFSIDAMRAQSDFLVKQISFEGFSEAIKKKFVESFPVSAWGGDKFSIKFTLGDYSISIVRKTYAKAVSEDFRLAFSSQFKDQYEGLLRKVRNLTAKNDEATFEEDFRFEWEILESSRNSIKKLTGDEYVSSQIFIPAGRSFFTSIGKAIAAFEQGRVLDPLIIQFGRLYTAYKSGRFISKDSKIERAQRDAFQNKLTNLIGGSLRIDGDSEYVRTPDGRNVPLQALSSGQQELLPLVAVLPHLLRNGSSLCYIEEPEAHLFPASQSKLVECLVSMLSGPSQGPGLSLVLTTHSPYVLVKINNLIKAGSLGRKRSTVLRKKVEEIVPTSSWLNGREVSAYAIKDGVVSSIINNSGFLDGDYMDEISSEISMEFDRLLDLEAEYD